MFMSPLERFADQVLHASGSPASRTSLGEREPQLLVESLQFLIGGLQLLVDGLQFLVNGAQFFVNPLQMLVRRLQLSDRFPVLGVDFLLTFLSQSHMLDRLMQFGHIPDQADGAAFLIPVDGEGSYLEAKDPRTGSVLDRKQFLGGISAIRGLRQPLQHPLANRVAQLQSAQWFADNFAADVAEQALGAIIPKRDDAVPG